MRLRLFALATVMLAMVLAAFVETSLAKGNRPRFLSGPGITQALAIPYPDGNLESLLDEPRPVPAPSDDLADPVKVWAEAWLQLIDWPKGEVSVPFNALVGLYYEDQGFLSLDTRSGEKWFALGSETRAVLDRYIRLARTGTVSDRPSQLGAYLASWQHLGEQIPLQVEIAGRRLTSEEAEAFWRLLADSSERDLLPSEFHSSATNFGPWTNHVWPADSSKDVSVRFCGSAGVCQQWYVLADQNFLTQTIVGWPSWPGFEFTPSLEDFVESQAGLAEVQDVENRTPLNWFWMIPIALVTLAGLFVISARIT